MLRLVFLLFLCSSLFANSLAAKELLINGAGATFPYPVYSKWFSEYREVDQSAKINYQGIGSGGGIRQLIRGTVDFGASDAPMSANEEKKLKFPVLHIPSVLGAVTLSYNLDLKKPLHLDGQAVAGIFLGKIRKWNDDLIKSLNPGVELPNKAIFVAHRSDGSGTTAVFTDYLSQVSPAWQKKAGKGKSIKWPAGIGAKGNAGVTGLIKNTPGAIGYIELTYALSNKLPLAAIKNQQGDFILPNAETVSAAAQNIEGKLLENKFKVSIANSAAKGAYPISTFTWLLIYEKMDKAKGEKVVNFLNWAISQPAQSMAKELHYAPLPEKVTKLVSQKIKSIQFK